MIYASDLDQTLIFSQRFLGDQSCKVRSVEVFEGKEITFMTERSIAMLKQLHDFLPFVPVTTRTQEQYERLSLFRNEIQPEFAVTSNGGKILHRGQAVVSWRQQIEESLRHDSAPLQTVSTAFHELAHSEWILLSKKAEDLFLYYIIDREKIPTAEIKDFTTWLDGQNWSMSIQGRKLYLVPNAVNKGAAVRYIAELKQEECIVAAGDSLLDLPMLRSASLALVPRHGEIFELARQGLLKDSVTFTSSEGMETAEEMLAIVLRQYVELLYEREKKIAELV